MKTLPSFNHFPLYRLPPKLHNAVIEAQAKTKAPLELIVASALATASVTFQRRYDVERQEGLRSPVSLFFLTIADSGERKSTVDSLFNKVISDFESEEVAKFNAAKAEYDPKVEVWKVEKNALVKRLEKGESISEKLEQHIKLEPSLPFARKLIYADVTPAALKEVFAQGDASIGVFSDEASSIFKGVTPFSDIGFINSAWGGKAIDVQRKSLKIHVENPRLSISMMAQPGVFNDFVTKNGDRLRDIGFLARFFVSYPLSTQGSRTLGNEMQWNYYQPTATNGLKDFNALIDAELRASSDSVKKVLRFSMQAESRWVGGFNDIESSMGQGGSLQGERDYASKEGEKIARLAALFHLIEGHEGDISFEMMQSAIEVSSWYLGEFKRLFAKPSQQDVLQADVAEIFNFIQRYIYRNATQFVKFNAILQNCPYRFRKKTNYIKCLVDINCQSGLLYRYQTTNSKGVLTQYVALTQSPSYPTQYPQVSSYPYRGYSNAY